MAAKKKTKAQIAAETKAKELKNPFTGQQPNSFTQVTNRTLDEPRAVRNSTRDEGMFRRNRALAREHLSTPADAPMGYRLDGISPQYRTFVTGMNHMLPNTAAERGEPAINEPHAADPGVTVQRRAEDLSGREVRKGYAALTQAGHDPQNPMESLREVHRRALDHVAAQHIAAGVNESASQMFYGGSPTTDLTPHDLGAQQHHDEGVMAARDRFQQGVRTVAQHPEFQAATAHLPHRERMHAATNLMAQATADTSPNTKWRDKPDAKYPWPNMEQAEESATAALENREPKFISGRIDNIHKAASRVADAVDTDDYSVHRYGNPVAAAKTVAFRGALVDKDASDAFKVSDVHEASVVAPWLPTAKAQKFSVRDDEGNKIGTSKDVYADTPKREYKGMTGETKPIMKQGRSVEVPVPGLSKPELMLNQGASTVHALNDYASRQVLAERGLSRGVNYADNVHSMQGAEWGIQQLKRSDVNVSPADQYPVKRDWESEGANVPANGDIRNLPHTSTTNFSPQFSKNDRTGRTQTIWPEDR